MLIWRSSGAHLTHDSERTGLLEMAPPARIGLATFGLGRRSDSQSEREVKALRGLIADLSDRARLGLMAIAEGDPHVWRIVTEVLSDVVDAGLALDAEEASHEKAVG